ncbi:MAG: DNA adenine methylase, partial [Nanoarchaeota archaeon]|nr:DNA adenine methylase [Nanoarchaeota archaeon]
MNPIIKWTGGKRQEFKEIEDMIPAFDRYVEPFFGGGAVFFSLEPKKAMINDKSKDLIDFYRLVKEGNQEFKEELFKMVDEWERLKQSFEDNKDKVDERIELGLKPELSRQIISNIKSKLARIKKIEEKENKVFNQAEMYEHIETAFRSGYYMYRRGLMNLDGFSSISKKMANYYFVREFCYGSMFRFNSDGKFNIPYGGIAYNKKDFRKKVEQVFKAKELFCDTVIDNVDFEEFFLKHNLT